MLKFEKKKIRRQKVKIIKIYLKWCTVCIDIARRLLCTCVISVYKFLSIWLPSYYLISKFLSSTVLVDFPYKGKWCPLRKSLHHISHPWIKCFMVIRNDRKSSVFMVWLYSMHRITYDECIGACLWIWFLINFTQLPPQNFTRSLCSRWINVCIDWVFSTDMMF